MRNLRLFYKKCGQAKYISHLDQNRMMTRAIKRAKMPVWYTEGFNPHVFLTFALPLSLGFESEYEIMDFRITDDELLNSEVAERFRKVMPENIEIIDVSEPIMSFKDLKFASFEIKLSAKTDLVDFINKDEILVEKYSKKKRQTSTYNFKDKINKIDLNFEDGVLNLSLILPAGNEGNVNPNLLLEAARKQGIDFTVISITRTMLFNQELKKFI